MNIILEAATTWPQDPSIVLGLFAGTITLTVTICAILVSQKDRFNVKRLEQMEARLQRDMNRMCLVAELVDNFTTAVSSHIEYQDGIIHQMAEAVNCDQLHFRSILREFRIGENEVARCQLEIGLLLLYNTSATDDAVKFEAAVNDLSQALGDMGSLRLFEKLKVLYKENKLICDILERGIKVMNVRIDHHLDTRQL